MLMRSSKSIASASSKRFWYVVYAREIIFNLKSSPTVRAYSAGEIKESFAREISFKIDFGVMFFSEISSSFKMLFIKRRWSSVSYTVKCEEYPMRSPSRRKIRAQVEWNVDAQMSLAVSPSMAHRRSFSSPAALFVKVIAMMRHGAHAETLKCSCDSVVSGVPFSI